MLKFLGIVYLVAFIVVCHLSLLSCNEPQSCLFEPKQGVLQEQNLISRAALFVAQQKFIPLKLLQFLGHFALLADVVLLCYLLLLVVQTIMVKLLNYLLTAVIIAALIYLLGQILLQYGKQAVWGQTLGQISSQIYPGIQQAVVKTKLLFEKSFPSTNQM